MKHFELGKTFTTNRVSKMMEESDKFRHFVESSFQRFLRCDWGEISDDDRKANDDGLENYDTLIASYTSNELRQKIWIITEADRSMTTILFPDEY